MAQREGGRGGRPLVDRSWAVSAHPLRSAIASALVLNTNSSPTIARGRADPHLCSQEYSLKSRAACFMTFCVRIQQLYVQCASTALFTGDITRMTNEKICL